MYDKKNGVLVTERDGSTRPMVLQTSKSEIFHDSNQIPEGKHLVLTKSLEFFIYFYVRRSSSTKNRIGEKR